MAARSNDPVRGRTIRFSWSEGPTKGKAYDHIFHEDGTVEFHAVPQAQPRAEPPERPQYCNVAVNDKVRLVSYLSKSGYTLTVALNFDDSAMVGVASNDKSWFPVRGSFEVLR